MPKPAVELYILRHAKAVRRGSRFYPHDDRPLTSEWIRGMSRAARGIKRIVNVADLILTSPMKRAYQTALITAEALSCRKKLIVDSGLMPGSSPKKIIEALMKHKARGKVFVVGHEPDLSLLVSYILGAQGSCIHFKKGGLCRIDIFEKRRFRKGVLEWHLQPELLGRIGLSPR
jgi:phosphohistidine phosphatase